MRRIYIFKPLQRAHHKFTMSVPEPALTETCNCFPCREGFQGFCEVGYPVAISHVHDFGCSNKEDDYRLEMMLQSIIQCDNWTCPCSVGAEYDELLERLGYKWKENGDEIREQFIKYYKDCTSLEECEEDECEYPDGHDPADMCGDFDYGQYLIDQQQAYWDGVYEEQLASKRY